MKTKDLETKIRQAKLQLGDDFGDEKMMEEAIFKAGENTEKQRWIKFFKQNNITIEQPQQLNRIIPQLKGNNRDAGIKEENQRTLLYLQSMAKSHPKISLRETLELIDVSKPS